MRITHDVLVAIVAGGIVAGMTWQATAWPPGFTTGDDGDGECMGFRNCTDWECPNPDGTSGCYPCTGSASIEFCAGSDGPGCEDEITDGGCGTKDWGNCTANGCTIGGNNGVECDSRTCTENAAVAIN